MVRRRSKRVRRNQSGGFLALIARNLIPKLARAKLRRKLEQQLLPKNRKQRGGFLVNAAKIALKKWPEAYKNAKSDAKRDAARIYEEVMAKRRAMLRRMR